MPENMTCDYCGKIREEIKFFIGASLAEDIDWTMWEGSAKTSCDNPECWAKGRAESKIIINAYVKALS